MSTYTWDEVPEDAELSAALPSVQSEITATVQRLLSEEAYTDLKSFGARVFERKGYHSYSEISSEHNRSYGSESDDVLLQVTIRVQASEVPELLSFAKREGEIARDAKLTAAREKLDREIAELQKQRNDLG